MISIMFIKEKFVLLILILRSKYYYVRLFFQLELPFYFQQTMLTLFLTLTWHVLSPTIAKHVFDFNLNMAVIRRVPTQTTKTLIFCYLMENQNCNAYIYINVNDTYYCISFMFNEYLLTTVSRLGTCVISKLHRNAMRKMLSIFFSPLRKLKLRSYK